MAADTRQTPTARRQLLWRLIEFCAVFTSLGYIFLRGAFMAVGCVAILALVVTGAGLWWLERRLRPGLARRIRLATMLSLAAVAAAAGHAVTRPSVLFRDYVAPQIPPSVEILHSEYQGHVMDPVIYLHFKLDPKDLDTILGARTYEPSQTHWLRVGGCPDWFRPDTLSHPSAYGWWGPPWPSSKATGSGRLWVSETRDAVYFVYMYN